MRRYPNNTAQVGTYYTGTTNYVHVPSNGETLAGRVTFASRAASDSWADGDTFGIRIEKSPTVFVVWKAQWSSSAQTLSCVTQEDSAGTLLNGDTVTVRATLTAATMEEAITDLMNGTGVVRAQNLVPVNGVFEVPLTTTLVLDSTHNGKTLCLAASAETGIYLGSLPSGFHCIVIEENANGAIAYAQSGCTVNGQASATLPGEGKGTYFYQRVPGVWHALV